MDDELREAVEFGQSIGAKSISYETPNGKVSVVFPDAVPEVGFAIPEDYQQPEPDAKKEDDFLLYYSSGGT